MTLKIESNIPVPQNGFGGGRPMSEETHIALKMKPGDSILCPTERIYARIINTLRRRKIAFTSRKVEGGYRVWRVDGRKLQKAANA